MSEQDAKGASDENYRSFKTSIKLGQFLWILLAGIALLVYFSCVPYYYLDLQQSAIDSDSTSYLGIMPSVYAGFITVRDIFVTLIFLIGSLIIIQRRFDNELGLYSSAVLLLGGVAIPATFQTTLPPELSLIADFLYSLSSFGFIVFLFVVPDGKFYPRVAKYLVGFWILITFIVEMVSFLFPFLGWPENAFFPFAMLWLGCGLLIQLHRYMQYYDPVKKQQTKWIILGFSLIFIGLFAMSLGRILVSLSLGWEVADLYYNFIFITVCGVSPAISMPSTVASAVLQYRLWDLEYLGKKVLAQTMQYALISTITVLILSLLNFVLALGLSVMELILIVVHVILFAALIQPISNRFEKVVQTVIYRGKSDPKTSALELGKNIRITVELEKIAYRVTNYILSNFDSVCVSFFSYDKKDGFNLLESKGIDESIAFEIIEESNLLDKELTPGMATFCSRNEISIILPLVGSSLSGDTLTGVILIGPKGSGIGYSSEEIQILENVASQAGTAILVAQLAAALSQTENRFQSLVLTTPDAIVECDEEGHITFANENAAYIIGHSNPLDLIGRKVFDFIDPEYLEVAYEELNPEKVADTEHPAPEIYLLKVDGTQFPAEINAAVNYNDDGSFNSYVIVFRDITMRIIYEEELKAARDRAVFYLDLMGHDIRNQLQVLSAVSGFAELAADDSAYHHTIQSLKKAVERCERIISKVELTDALQSSTLKPTNIVPVIKEIVADYCVIYPDVEIHEDIGIDKAMVMADRYLGLLCENLLENAIEHNPNEKKEVWIDLVESERGFTLSVDDNGKGIHDTRKKELFDMARRYGGVGLHQCREIVSRYGGRISADDRIKGRSKEGARFSVWLPAIIH
jgi:PAS domain S-box-containing protein